MGKEFDELIGFDFKIEKIEETSMDNGNDAFILYLKIDNKTPKKRKINLLLGTYVTTKREQLEQDIWLTGYITGEDTIQPNSFKKAGLVFYKPKLKYISNGDLLYITIKLIDEGVELTQCFQKSENNWLLVDIEKTEIEIKLTPKQSEKNLLGRIEKLEVFEERLNVSLQNLSIRIDESDNDYGWFNLFCELHSNNGTSINEYMRVECVLYDKEGLVLASERVGINPDDFFGFEVIKFRFQEEGLSKKVNKIRIYPKK